MQVLNGANVAEKRELLITMLELNGYISDRMIKKTLGPDIRGHALRRFKNMLRAENEIREVMISTGAAKGKGSSGKYSSIDLFGRKVQDRYFVLDMETFRAQVSADLAHRFTSKNPGASSGIYIKYLYFMRINGLEAKKNPI